jgi:hypothetical protein
MRGAKGLVRTWWRVEPHIFSERPPECPLIEFIVLSSECFIYVHEGQNAKRVTRIIQWECELDMSRVGPSDNPKGPYVVYN